MSLYEILFWSLKGTLLYNILVKRFIFLWFIIIAAGIYGWRIANTNTTIIAKTESSNQPTPSITSQPDQTIAETSLFLPYWALSGQQALPKTYTSYLYFGIEATKLGIDTKEDGYINLSQFLSLVPVNSNKLLVIRMINSEDNSAILSNHNIQRSIISDTVTLAKERILRCRIGS